MVIKRSPGGQACRWRAVNFEIHLWSSGKNADRIFGDRSASSMSKWRPAWFLTPEMIPFGTKSVTLSMLIDLLTSTMSCRSTQVKIASTDLWPQEMFTFSEMLALVESESSFGAYVCHRRPGGSQRLAILSKRCEVMCEEKKYIRIVCRPAWISAWKKEYMLLVACAWVLKVSRVTSFPMNAQISFFQYLGWFRGRLKHQKKWAVAGQFLHFYMR